MFYFLILGAIHQACMLRGGGGAVKLKAYTYCRDGWIESVTFERMYFMDDCKQKNGDVVQF